MAMKTPLAPGETLVKEGRANLQRGIESVGGHLYLTDRRLIFESHRLNVQSGPTEIALADITDIRKAWTKFLGVIPMAPNSLAVTTRDGQARQIVLSGRDKWLEAIYGPAPGG
jgi:hypothetical protein